MRKLFPVLAAATLVAAMTTAGCGNNANSVPNHTPEEQKAIDQVKSLTPEQQIDRIEKGPMPPAAKQAMIQKIKSQNGMK